jgi:hypothetical protein
MRAGGFAASPFVLCMTALIHQKKNLNNASWQTQMTYSSSLGGMGGRLRLPVFSGSTLDSILTELP